MNILLFAGYLIADFGTTAIGVQFGLRELNPLADSFGDTRFLILKAVATVAVVLLVWRLGDKLSPRGIQALTVMLAAVTLSNSLIIYAL